MPLNRCLLCIFIFSTTSRRGHRKLGSQVLFFIRGHTSCTVETMHYFYISEFPGGKGKCIIKRKKMCIRRSWQFANFKVCIYCVKCWCSIEVYRYSIGYTQTILFGYNFHFPRISTFNIYFLNRRSFIFFLLMKKNVYATCVVGLV